MYLEKFDLEMTARFVGEKVANFDDGTGRTADRQHRIKLERDGKAVEFDFYPSTFNPVVDSDKDYLTALGCYLMDASCAKDDIDDFVQDYCGTAKFKVSQVIESWKGCLRAKRNLDVMFSKEEQEELYDYLSEGGYL